MNYTRKDVESVFKRLVELIGGNEPGATVADHTENSATEELTVPLSAFLDKQALSA